MKRLHLATAVAAFALAASVAAPSYAEGACPTFTIKVEVGKTKTAAGTEVPAARFTVSPAPDGALFNWTVSSGTIVQGQGTAAIMVEGVKGQKITASLQVLELDVCPEAPTISATAKVD